MKHILPKCILFALIALAIELFGFNFRTFESLTFIPAQQWTLTDTAGAKLPMESRLTADENGESVFVIENIGQTAGNLYLDLEGPSSDGFFAIKIKARDEGNNQYYSLPETAVSAVREADKYIRLNLSGKAKSLRVTVKTEAGEELIIKNVDINRIRPLDLSPVRIAATFFIIVVLWGLRPGAPVYAIKYNPKDAFQTGLLICLMAAFLGGCIGISQGDPRYCDPPWAHHYQYHQLAVSLTEGHFYLDIEPSEDLMAMENPYDNNQRDADQVEFQWDTAYFNGKYYSYFGILPVFVYYLPYYLITGQAFPTYVGILINVAFIIAGAYFLLRALARKYFPNTSLGVFILCQCMLILGCGTLLIVNPPTFYNMPGSMALALTLWGLYFWLRAAKNPRIHPGFLSLGALLMALVAASRPQMLVGSFLIIPIFWGHIKSALSGKQFRTFVLNFVQAALPYMIVAALVMYYNFARFGSPFDFGANYNLTTNDMTHRGFHLDRLPFGIFAYLFQTPSLIGHFPFMSSVSLQNTYQGMTIAETMYGGFFWFNCGTMALVFLGNVKRELKEKKLWLLSILSAVMAVIVVCADVEMAGILQRYGSDFGLFFILPAVICILALGEKATNGDGQKIYQKALYLSFIWTAGINFVWLLAK